MSAADDLRTYHRRTSGLNSSNQVATLCGRLVDYAQANGSLTNVDCPACIGAAHRIVENFVEICRGTVKGVLELEQPPKP